MVLAKSIEPTNEPSAAPNPSFNSDAASASQFHHRNAPHRQRRLTPYVRPLELMLIQLPAPIPSAPIWLVGMELTLDICIIIHGITLALRPTLYNHPHPLWNPTYHQWTIARRKLFGWLLVAIGLLLLYFSGIPKLFPERPNPSFNPDAASA